MTDTTHDPLIAEIKAIRAGLPRDTSGSAQALSGDEVSDLDEIRRLLRVADEDIYGYSDCRDRTPAEVEEWLKTEADAEDGTDYRECGYVPMIQYTIIDRPCAAWHISAARALAERFK
jgi:hypothetical protein